MYRTLRDDDRGQGLAEYGVILGFVAAVCVAALSLIGSGVLNNLHTVSTNYP